MRYGPDRDGTVYTERLHVFAVARACLDRPRRA